MTSKKDKKLLMDKFNNLIDDAGRRLTGNDSPASNTLEDMKRQYETVSVKIKKKNKAGDWALFAQLDNQSPKYLIETGLDVICMEQGGGGEYEVWIAPPGVVPHKYWGGSIMGVSQDVSKISREAQGPFASLLGGTAPGAGGSSTPGASILSPQLLGHSMDVVAKQGETSTDRLMMMQLQMQQMQQQAAERQFQIQQAAADKQMQMMMLMFGKGEAARSGPSESEVAMREELRRLREERDHDRRREEDRRLQDLERRLQEQRNDQMVEIMKVGNRGDKDTGTLIASIFSNTQQQSQQQQIQYLQLMEKLMNRPSEGEKIGELANVMLNTQMGQMQLMTQAMQSGLFGGGDSKHPILEAVKEGISALREMGSRAMPGAGGYQEEEYEEEEMPVGPAQVRRGPEAQPPQLPEGPMGGVPQQPQQQQQQPWNVPEDNAEAPRIPPEALLTQEDLERLEKDRALVPVTAAILRGDDPSEIPMRLYVYATTGGSKFASKWLQYPLEVTVQVCSFLDVGQARAQEVLDALVAFIEFVTPVEDGGQGHDPQEWGGNYTAKKRAPDKRAASQAQHAAASYGGGNGGAPEIGVTKGAPRVQGEEYDPSRLPEGISPEQAEALAAQANDALASLQPNNGQQQ